MHSLAKGMQQLEKSYTFGVAFYGFSPRSLGLVGGRAELARREDDILNLPFPHNRIRRILLLVNFSSRFLPNQDKQINVAWFLIVVGGRIFGFSKVVAILETGWYLSPVSPVCLMTKLMFIDPPIRWQTLGLLSRVQFWALPVLVIVSICERSGFSKEPRFNRCIANQSIVPSSI